MLKLLPTFVIGLGKAGLMNMPWVGLLDRPKEEHNKMRVKWLDWDKVESTITPSSIVIHTTGQTKPISIYALS